MKTRVYEGEKVPAFYGVAYRQYEYNWTVCYPIPINLVVKFFRNIHYHIKTCGRKAAKWEIREAQLTNTVREIATEKARIKAQEEMYPLAERIAEKMFQEKFQEEWNRRIDVLLALQRNGK